MTCEHMRPSLGGARLPLATFSPSCTPHHVSFRLFATLPKVPQLLKLVEDIPVELQHAAVGPGDARLPLLVADCDAVMQMYIDAGQGDKDPYWTCPWPSSLAMAEELMARPELVRGLRVADVGCGLGLGGVAAALAGAAEVVFLDRRGRRHEPRPIGVVPRAARAPGHRRPRWSKKVHNMIQRKMKQ